MSLRVAVAGASGRMGALVCAAVEATDDMSLVARINRGGSVEQAVEAGAQVLVDFTHPDISLRLVTDAVSAGLHVVVGTSGYDQERLEEIRRILASCQSVGVVVAPNFALGAVLLMRFAEQAAPYFESVEVIEMHHPNKVDAPSGTAIATAEAVASARLRAGVSLAPDATTKSLDGARGSNVAGIPLHSVRLRGLNAHMEVLFGGAGETLALRHDAFDRSCYMSGVLLAIRKVVTKPGLTVGLELLLWPLETTVT